MANGRGRIRKSRPANEVLGIFAPAFRKWIPFLAASTCVQSIYQLFRPVQLGNYDEFERFPKFFIWRRAFAKKTPDCPDDGTKEI